MAESQEIRQDEGGALEQAYRRGRRGGLAVAALALSLVAFVNLLSVEKAILAIVLAAVSLRGAERGTRERRFGVAAVAIALVYFSLAIFAVIVFHDQIGKIGLLLQQME